MSTPLRERPDAPLGTLIFRAGLLPAETIESALEEGVKTGKRLGEILTERGLIKEVDLARLLAGQKGLAFVILREQIVDTAAAGLFSPEQARLFRALPYAFEDGVPVIAIADPTDDVLTRNIREALGREDAKFVVSTRSELADVVEDVYPESVETSAEAAPMPAPEPQPELRLQVPAPDPEPPAEPVAFAAEAPPAEPAPPSEPLLRVDPAPVAEPVAPAPAPHISESDLSANGSGELEPPAALDTTPPSAEPTPATVAPEPAPSTFAPAVPQEQPEPLVAAESHAAVEPAPVSERAAESQPAVEPAQVPEPAPEPELEPTPSPPLPAAGTAYRVAIRLTNGERVEAGAFADVEAAKAQAKSLIAQIAAADGGDWPFVNGRFLKPDTIVSVDLA